MIYDNEMKDRVEELKSELQELLKRHNKYLKALHDISLCSQSSMSSKSECGRIAREAIKEFSNET